MNTPIRQHGDGTRRDLDSLQLEHDKARANWKRLLLSRALDTGFTRASETDINYALNEYMRASVELKRYRDGK